MIDHRRLMDNIPENTAYDRRRHEEMRLRPHDKNYGNRYFQYQRLSPICQACGKEIPGTFVKIDNINYHEHCFNAKNREQ